MFKLLKWGLIGGAAALVVGALVFGTDLFSYARSSGKMMKRTVNDLIPVQFEIQRARDLLDELVPEMHANLRLVAEEEVEVAALEKEVTREREGVSNEREAVQKMRRDLEVRPVAYVEGNPGSTSFVDDLSRRFERFRTKELLLAGKEKLLSNRKNSLQAAIQRLEKTKVARVELAAQIESLEGQFRLLQAQGTASDLRINDTKLAQTQRLLGDLRKRLEVAQKVLEREADFSELPPVQKITPEKLAEQIDSHFHPAGPMPEAAPSKSPVAGAVRY